MNAWPYPCLIADIGGTNIRFAQVDSAEQPFTEVARSIAKYATADHPDLQSAARQWIQDRGGSLAKPRSAAVAIASPITGERTTLTNSNFLVDRPRTMEGLDLDAMQVLNDFEALSWSLPCLRDEDIRPIGRLLPSRDRTMVVLGPGTGLGCAGLVRHRDQWIPVPGEGGHVTQSAADDDDAEILRAARRKRSHVSAERLLSGIGLPTLYAAVADVDGVRVTPPSPEMEGPEPAVIVKAAMDGSDPVAVRTIDTFCSMLGTLAGNLALVFNAWGGVLIGGGIGSHVEPILQRSKFRERFESKGRYQKYLAETGTALIVHEQPALLGLQHALRG